MSSEIKNPFNITKAVDYSDKEIVDYWVDLSENKIRSSFRDLIKPTSPVPMFIMGSKGSGKTHLMRYYSFECQALRNHQDLNSGIKKEGYLGVYLICSGLNASRYKGKNKSNEFWDDIFSYSFDLWIVQILLNNIVKSNIVAKKYEKKIATEIHKLLGTEKKLNSLDDILQHIVKTQRDLDRAVNNILHSNDFSSTIQINKGELIYRIPQIIRECIPDFSNIIVVYLIDEFENLTESQQKYINTLVRDKKLGSTFKVGAKLWGVKTRMTLSDKEEIKEGSEFEKLHIDSKLREDEKIYSEFAEKLVASRLTQSQSTNLTDSNSLSLKNKNIGGFFADIDIESLSKKASEKYKSSEAPWLKNVTTKLKKGIKAGSTNGLLELSEIDRIIANLSCEAAPLIEKINCLVFFKEWSKSKDLKKVSENIKNNCSCYISGREADSTYLEAIKHHKLDMLAQLLKSSGHPQKHLGYDHFVSMSWGVPRGLFVLLKNIYSWADFKGESPFSGGLISIEAQSLGVSDAADWFFEDSRSFGDKGHRIQVGIERLATLLRAIRFADKPSESSPSSFACDFTTLNEESIDLVRTAALHSLIVNVGKRKAKNSSRMLELYQINRMLAPKWDLPISRRGVTELRSEEISAIFVEPEDDNFNFFLDERRKKMEAPMFGKGKSDNTKDLFI